jgi:nascent polypeptide-associated complex subunit alpha
MIPGMNPRDMQKAMKRLGIKQEEIPATEVIIKTPDRDLVIPNPQVSKVNMMGQNTFQIVGEAHEQEKDTTPSISEEDVKTVMEQASVSEDKAREALESSKGDLAEAILVLQGE